MVNIVNVNLSTYFVFLLLKTYYLQPSTQLFLFLK